MTINLLAIDSDVEFTSLLATHLSAEGFHLTIEKEGESAIKRALNQSFDAITLDLILPKKNGYEVLKTIRQHQTTPIIILTTRNEDIDRVLAFEDGADDYMLKPCHPQELKLRVQNILKRTQKTIPERINLKENGVILDAVSRHVVKDGDNIELTNTEFNILEMLMRSPGQAFSKEELTEYALGRKYSSFDRSIDVHVSHLRFKLGDNPHREPFIKTIRGFGYAFNV